MENNTKVVCAWCGLHMKGEETAHQVSHSCCPACEKKENEKLDRKPGAVHTPTPWRAVQKGGDIEIWGDLDFPLATVTISYSTEDLEETAETEANAALIIRAVNSHESTVDALKNALSVFNVLCEEDERLNHDKRVGVAITALQRAIKQAEDK